MKTSELTGAALDWAVAKCEGLLAPDGVRLSDEYCDSLHHDQDGGFSTDWSQGGPIIEREKISVWYRVGVNLTANIDGKHEQSVPYSQPNAQLTVAMRCYVASKLGDEVEIPEELQ